MAACKILNDLKLHYYQLLYTQNPRMTCAGAGASPFEVLNDSVHQACIKIKFKGKSEYDFFVTPGEKQKLTDGEWDEQILEKCKLILCAHKEEKQKIHPKACCGLASVRLCVCEISFECPLHGVKCYGTHD